MVIGIDIRSLSDGVGGIPEYTRNVVQTLLSSERKHFYVLFTNAARGADTIPFSAHGPHHQLCVLHYPNKLLHASLFFAHRPSLDSLIYHHTKKRIDLLFFPNIHFLAYSSRVPAVITVHDLSFLHYPDLFSRKGRLWHRLTSPRCALKNAAHLCAVSEWTRHDLVRSYGIDQARVTVTPLDCAPEFRQSAGITDESRRDLVLLFGADNLRKNAVGIIEAWIDALRAGRLEGAYTLVCVGRTAQRGQANERIRFMTPVSRRERLALYARAAALLYPSITEGFGIPLVEAARMRVPIITANHSSIGEVIGSGAAYVDPYSVTAMSAAMHDVLTNKQLRASLIREAAAAVERFSWKETAARTRTVFEHTYDHWH